MARVMEIQVTLRYWLAGALCVLVLLGAAWSVFLYRDLASRSCSSCAGYGSFTDRLGATVFCARCGGSGRGVTMTALGNQLVEMILEARKEFLWRLANRPAEPLIYGGCFLSLLGLAALVRVVGCRRCGGRIREPECSVCGGRGRATVIDQIVGRP